MKDKVDRNALTRLPASFLLLFMVSLLMAAPAVAADPVYGWTRTFGGNGPDMGHRVATDLEGNIYLSGQFEGRVSFAADFGGKDFKRSNGSADGFITRVNADGSYGWTRTFGGNWFDAGATLTVDPAGNLYAAGVFHGTVNFAADFGRTDRKTSLGNIEIHDLFLMRINADGSYGWTRVFGGPNRNEFIMSLGVDRAGGAYLFGEFGGAVNFARDFGGLDTRSSTGGNDFFITRVNPDGGYGWTTQIPDDCPAVNGIPGDPLGATLMLGGKIFRVNSAGKIEWIRFRKATYSITKRAGIDQMGNIYYAGSFWDREFFGVGRPNYLYFKEPYLTELAPGTRVGDVFVTRHNADGSYGWTRSLGGPEFMHRMTVDAMGNIYVVGSFRGSVNFREDFGGTDIKGMDSIFGNTYVTRVNADGSYGWTRMFSRGISCEQGDIVADPFGNLYLTGSFAGGIFSNNVPADFAADFGRSDVRTGVEGDIFLLKIGAGAESNPDTDGDGVIDNNDCAPLDPAHWSDCGICADADGDGYLANCNTYPDGISDCNDFDPYLNVSCVICIDADGDAHGEYCDPGPDCDDSNPRAWDTCETCADLDGDGWWAGCNDYPDGLGPDCKQKNKNRHDHQLCAIKLTAAGADGGDAEGDGGGGGCALAPGWNGAGAASWAALPLLLLLALRRARRRKK